MLRETSSRCLNLTERLIFSTSTCNQTNATGIKPEKYHLPFQQGRTLLTLEIGSKRQTRGLWSARARGGEPRQHGRRDAAAKPSRCLEWLRQTSSPLELLAQNLIGELGIGLTAGLLHQLTDKEALQFVLTAAEGFHFIGMRG